MLPIKKDLKLVKSLHQKKFRKEHGLFLIEGKKPVEEALQSNFRLHSLYSCDEVFIEKFSQGILINSKDMAMISALNTPSDYLAVLHVPEFNPTSFISKKQILLDGISDPGNMGTILRTADWFGFDEIICSEDTVELYNPKVVQSTMGSLFRVKVMYTDLPKYIDSITEKGFAIAGADLDGVNAFEYQFPEKTALVIGSESHGIRPNVESLLTQKVHIPGSGNAESLNAGIAAGILLSCWFKIKS